MPNLKRVYWDACAWIAYINQEKSVKKQNGRFEDRFAMCREVLNQANNGDLEIATSAFTLAEVCKNPEVKDSPVDNLPGFFEKSYILIVPVDMDIGRKAQNLQTSGVGNLKPADSIHLASAQRANVEELHTFDDNILNLNGVISASDGDPLKICKLGAGPPLGGLFENVENE